VGCSFACVGGGRRVRTPPAAGLASLRGPAPFETVARAT